MIALYALSALLLLYAIEAVWILLGVRHEYREQREAHRG